MIARPRPRLLVVVALFAAPAFAGTPPANSCADDYWADSLRCRTAEVGAAPQPEPAPPASVAQIREFTRVDLESDWNVRCLDGTRPVLYVAPAADPESSKWLISLTGGGSCWANDADGDLVVDGRDCAAKYLDGEAGEMGTSSEPAMKSLSDSQPRAEGILRSSSALNPHFSDYHRVRIEKCSYDRYNGRSTHAGVELDDSTTYDLFTHGRAIVELALTGLRGDVDGDTGLAYTTWVDQGGVVTEVVASLPPLEAATQVVFVGHSGGGHGLYHSIDGYNSFLHAWPAFEGDVRGVVDANFLPGPENEADFDSGQPGADLYDHSWSGTTVAAGTYDGEELYTTGLFGEQYAAYLAAPGDSLATIHDASCVAAHAKDGNQHWCRDRIHVLANHVTTPLFVREDLSDPNSEHTANGAGHPLLWGPWSDYEHCAPETPTCPPLLPVGDGSPHETRLRTQAGRIATERAARSELALGDDPSGALPALYFWMPDCASHAGTYDEHQYNRVALSNGVSSVTLRELLESFVAAGAAGPVVARVEGFAGDVALCQGDLPFSDGFESGDDDGWSSAVD